MIISLTPSAATQRLIKNLSNAPKIVQQAKHKALSTASLIFQAKAKEEAPVDTTNLRKNIKYKVESDGNQAKVYVDPAIDYARYQEEGTGIFGPKRRMITPKHGKFLVFKVKSGKTVFAKQVKGSRAKWYMKKGSEELQRQKAKVDDVLYQELVKGLSA